MSGTTESGVRQGVTSVHLVSETGLSLLFSSDKGLAPAERTDDLSRRTNRNTRSIQRIEPELPYLRRYARALTRNIDEADDLVQDCVVRAIANIDKWEPGTQMRPWLIVIARNIFYNRCRHSRREREAMTEIGLSGVHSTAPSQDVSLELGDVAQAYESLSTEHREVLNLVVIEGMDYETTAKIMDVAVGTVKSRLSRARQNLRDKVESTARGRLVRFRHKAQR